MDSNPYESPETPGTPPPQPSSFKGWVVGTLTVLGIIVVLVAILLPMKRGVSEAARQTMCTNHLKHIGIALSNYHDTYGSFPPAYTVDKNGQRLHSWRTLILPFMEQQTLYEKIDLTKPWDDPVNQKAAETRPSAYRCPSLGSNAHPQHTPYLAVVTPASCFPPGGTKTLADITDGPDSTVLIVEVDSGQTVPWMSPADADEQTFTRIGKSSQTLHPSGFHGLLADFSVRFLSKDTTPETLRALVSIAGNDDAAIE